MPVVIYATSTTDLERLRAALKGWRTEVFTGERKSMDVFREARCLVAAARREKLAEAGDELETVVRRHPHMPVILVTDDPSAAALSLSSIAVHRFVGFDGLSEMLPKLVREAGLSGWFERMARQARASEVRPLLGRAMSLALRAGERTPFQYTSTVAKQVGCTPETLARALNSAVQGAYRPGDFLSAIQVVRARNLRGAGSSWRAAASAVNCHYETLRRKSMRWPGPPPAASMRSTLTHFSAASRRTSWHLSHGGCHSLALRCRKHGRLSAAQDHNLVEVIRMRRVLSSFAGNRQSRSVAYLASRHQSRGRAESDAFTFEAR